MMRWFVAVLIVVCTSTPLAAWEVRADIGFFDSAFWVGSERIHEYRIGVEFGNKFRFGLNLLKEGDRIFDGWGFELKIGRRHSLGAGFLGTFRGGVGWRMQTAASSAFSEGPEGRFHNWTWRTLRLNAPFVDEAMMYPFVSYGIQRNVLGPFFLHAQAQLAPCPTLTRWGWGEEGAVRSESLHSWRLIPGYHIGLGVEF